MSDRQVIGLHGHSGAGKSTVAARLTTRHQFAEVNMGMLIAEFVLKGEGLQNVYDPVFDYDRLKEDLPGFHQKLVTYGNAARDTFGSTVWADRLRDLIEMYRNEGFHVVWSNVRTEADYELLQSLGGRFVRVLRPLGDRVFSRLDTELDRIAADVTIENIGSVDGLNWKVDQLVEKWGLEVTR